jgi:DNA-binding IclR family transcriptional regulator
MEDRKNQSTLKAWELVDILMEYGPCRMSDISTHIDLSRASAYTYLQTLESLGLVERENKEYSLSTKFIIYGDYVRDNLRMYEYGQTYTDEISETTGETALLSIPQNQLSIQVYLSYGKHSVAENYYQQAKEHPIPAYCSAAGKAHLAFTKDGKLEELIEKMDLEARTDATLTNEADLREELETVRSQGVAFNDEESLKGLRAVAAPIVINGAIEGSISIGGAKERFPDERLRGELADLAKEKSNAIEVEIRSAK